VCSNHAPVPARAIAGLREDPRVAISAECWAAVKRLREVYGMASASPFSYFDSLSPFLNVYAEPEEFLVAEDRAALEPIAFFGGVAPDLHMSSGSSVFGQRDARKIFVSFGTLIWHYYAQQAYAALSALGDAFAALDVEAVFSLGGHDLAAEDRDGLEKPNVRVVSFADQWQTLREADVFVTHHGINSTHEALFHQVPMLSYPFLGDQPMLARRCGDLGLAVPLVEDTMAPLTPAGVRAALARLDDDADGYRTRLAAARSWELRTIADRGAVIDRILALAP
jgi:UDP:flavonoid glycosyltransferase YjiC (YdhE family)